MPVDRAHIRAIEIQTWIQNSNLQVRNWIAIDDMPLETLAPHIMRNHFVKTDPFDGLTRERVKYAITLLQSELTDSDRNNALEMELNANLQSTLI